MDEILNSIANGQWRQAIEQIKESRIDIEDTYKELSKEDIISLHKVAVNTGYLTVNPIDTLSVREEGIHDKLYYYITFNISKIGAVNQIKNNTHSNFYKFDRETRETLLKKHKDSVKFKYAKEIKRRKQI
jgi:hypothetical protein